MTPPPLPRAHATLAFFASLAFWPIYTCLKPQARLWVRGSRAENAGTPSPSITLGNTTSIRSKAVIQIPPYAKRASRKIWRKFRKVLEQGQGWGGGGRKLAKDLADGFAYNLDL
eukprot:1352355-Amorphochlora_amoeboformis.AAC.1